MLGKLSIFIIWLFDKAIKGCPMVPTESIWRVGSDGQSYLALINAVATTIRTAAALSRAEGGTTVKIFHRMSPESTLRGFRCLSNKYRRQL